MQKSLKYGHVHACQHVTTRAKIFLFCPHTLCPNLKVYVLFRPIRTSFLLNQQKSGCTTSAHLPYPKTHHIKPIPYHHNIPHHTVIFFFSLIPCEHNPTITDHLSTSPQHPSHPHHASASNSSTTFNTYQTISNVSSSTSSSSTTPFHKTSSSSLPL